MTTSRSGPPRARPAVGGQVTIQDVARAAGVGRQTVSNVLNDSGRVGEATKVRVLEAVAALGYHPHHGARSLRSRRTRQLAYVMPRVQLLPGNYIMQQFLQALAAASARRSHSVVVVVPDGDPGDEMRRLIASRTVDAFLLSELQPEDPRVVLLAEAGIPFACFGRIGSGLPQHWVDIDNRAAIREMTEHALARGHTRIAFFGYDPQGGWDLDREAGYREVMAAASLPVTLVRTTMAPADVDATVTDLLRPPDRPSAIITGSDLLAAACYAAASRAGLRIGADLAVTGFDGSVISRILVPALTTVAMPMAELASRLVDRIISEVDGASDDRGEVLATTLVWGESLSAYR